MVDKFAKKETRLIGGVLLLGPSEINDIPVFSFSPSFNRGEIIY